MHDEEHMPTEKQFALKEIAQIAISCWAVASFIWYFRKFFPAFTPILKQLLRHIWH